MNSPAVHRRPNREIAFGAVGKFWQPVIEWRDVPRAEFNGFAEPGWGKIAANFCVLPYGERSTLLSYECRTVTTDPESRRRFLLVADPAVRRAHHAGDGEANQGQR